MLCMYISISRLSVDLIAYYLMFYELVDVLINLYLLIYTLQILFTVYSVVNKFFFSVIGKRRPPFLNGWEMSVQCLLQLWETLQQHYSFRFLFTNRLNQDCIENLFSVIRAKGGQRDNRNAGQFRAAFAQVIVDAVLLPSHHKNCVDDLDTFLIQLGSLQNKAAVSPAVPVVSSYEMMLANMPPTARCVFSVCTSQENDELSKQEKNIVAYISGYMVRKLRKCMCEGCFLYCTTGADDCDEDLDFITVKRYEEAKDGLISPSLSLVRTVCQLEAEYREVVENVILSDNAKSTLFSTLSKMLAWGTLIAASVVLVLPWCICL